MIRSVEGRLFRAFMDDPDWPRPRKWKQDDGSWSFVHGWYELRACGVYIGMTQSIEELDVWLMHPRRNRSARYEIVVRFPCQDPVRYRVSLKGNYLPEYHRC